VLTATAIRQFIRDGYIAVRGAVPADMVVECQGMLWKELANRGIERHDPSTWTLPVVRLDSPEEEPFVSAGTAPALWEAYDQLLGEGTWWKRRGLGGTIPVRFPSEADPGDAGWHIDGSFDGSDGRYWVNVRSKMRGLLVLFLLTDVEERGAPTRLLKGSHLDIPRVLAPAGDAGTSFERVGSQLPASTFRRERVFATGNAGDVYVCHPFLVHAASWPHRGTEPRMIAQPGVAILEPFRLSDAADEIDVCPVEAAILRGLREPS
jgi:hypothetical protein